MSRPIQIQALRVTLAALAFALLAACGPSPSGDAPAPKAAASASTPLTAEEQALQARLPDKVESDTTHAWVMDAILAVRVKVVVALIMQPTSVYASAPRPC
jgi:curli biogenesis system outer membrane secretion channel CsgG